jgi:hypothetical protein
MKVIIALLVFVNYRFYETEREVLDNCEYLTKHAPRSTAVVEVSPSFIPVHFSITV